MLLRASLAGSRAAKNESAPSRRRMHCSASAARRPAAARDAGPEPQPDLSRRAALGAALVSLAAAPLAATPPAAAYATKRTDDGDFKTTDSGLRILELRAGAGDVPRKGEKPINQALRWARGACRTLQTPLVVLMRVGAVSAR